MNAELHEVMGYPLGELPFVKPPTAQEMRKGLARATYYATLLRNATMMAEREGWSGEDKYTAIAFYLQLRNETLETLNLKQAMLDTRRLIR